ncbi:3' terminal RNA ribose 2'-O-methyltransferase Hen1 [Flammeovirga sp. EKP202]|uniref:3' terminal RNA ribose 2'-O-methyltransferase Hen1 n=1 Tax=Flammeovirga sp. EKP202 TaxID=2770592 RepID=UPI00165F18CA|nr:3' terminal RNA ribose 2'-O-methyltransferase Hen1 [Flammeovirga sp. EKP202]MBD0402522.1 3' terminal RNA ribose 2'-O-methyltransferase Hen1 [Flammeovirga sp. EKP202]
MLLNITTTHQPASVLGFMLHKHPDKLQTVKLSIGKAHVFYPESSEEKTTVSLLLDIDPIDMVRGGRNLSGKGFALGQYVNDRPYVASSFMSVALSKAFSTAMNGKCSHDPSLVDVEMPFEVSLTSLPAPKGGELLIRNMFEPLGYEVELERYTLDEKFTEWGDSKYFTLNLKHILKLKDLLSHLYVLIPALDNDKHYFVSNNEVEKLLDKGKEWLKNHPEKEQITKRYLFNLSHLSRKALEQLRDEDVAENEVEENVKKETLHTQRLKLVLEKLLASGAKNVIDLGCGEGKLIRMLIKEKQLEKIVGMDVSYQDLTKCRERLHWEEMAPKQKERIDLFQGALTYQDDRLAGFDAATIVEVIEHMDESRLQSFERVVFEFAKPKTVFLTTPNGEYNVLYESMEENTMRHTDHRFEWTRAEFETWANKVAETYNYTVSFLPIGEEDSKVGAPSQMAIFNHGN